MTPSSCWSNIDSMIAKDFKAERRHQALDDPGAHLRLPPAAFLPGISGQFYRQFALIAWALRMIGRQRRRRSVRAVSIFKTEQTSEGWDESGRPGPAVVVLRAVRGPGHALAGQALHRLTAGAAAGRHPGARAGPEMAALHRHRAVFPARRARRRGARLAHHQAGQFRARQLWGLQLGLREVTAPYGRAVGGLLRLSVIVLLLYGGLLTHRNTMTMLAQLHPRTGPGLSAGQRPAARRRQRAAHLGSDEEARADRPGRRHRPGTRTGRDEGGKSAYQGSGAWRTC